MCNGVYSFSPDCASYNGSSNDHDWIISECSDISLNPAAETHYGSNEKPQVIRSSHECLIFKVREYDDE